MAVNGSVAIVDDEKDVVRTSQLLFKRRNIPLSFTALDGPIAIEKFKKANPRPGVVIIDYRLSSMSDLQVLREVLAIEPGTKAIFVSGETGIEQESIESGAAVFMKKPEDIKKITDTVRRLIR